VAKAHVFPAGSFPAQVGTGIHEAEIVKVPVDEALPLAKIYPIYI
jgi:hypothetical protein